MILEKDIPQPKIDPAKYYAAEYFEFHYPQPNWFDRLWAKIEDWLD